MPDPDSFGNEDRVLTEIWLSGIGRTKDPVDQIRGYEKTPWHMLVNPLTQTVDGRVRVARVSVSHCPTCQRG